MLTIEIGGIPTAVTNVDEAQVREVFESPEFKRDLMIMNSDGTPLGDGKAPLTVRPAFRHEVALIETADEEPDMDDEAGDDYVFVTFLVPIDHDHEATSAIPSKPQG
ncbi:hypothetical protein [Microvirga sp. BSC39]|uniref:hypothetical protein n=1 Tax=Microvirga sp. BSC39 TaxID=1549810 RepID=UPI0006918088|nr:hypothetical protein [Microvirga sp. BSC39]